MSSKPTALILCNDFPPINSIGAERPNSWYLYFNELGIHPVVITKNWNSTGNSSFNQIHNHCKKRIQIMAHLSKHPDGIHLPFGLKVRTLNDLALLVKD
jgi:hypothetical protein